MKLITPPNPDIIIEATEQEIKEISTFTGGIMVRHKKAWFALVYGKWIMILPEKETEKDEAGQKPKRN